MHDTIDHIVQYLRKKTVQSPEPMTREIVSFYGKNSYLILTSCLLSLQNRDVVTLPISMKLFEHAQTPEQMLKLPIQDIEKIIKPINYYKTKAQRLHSVSQELIDRFDGQVPCSIDKLMSIKGVGLKTANLVLAEAFDVPAICVDTHVHRLSNHWGLIDTQMPEQTEVALRQVLPEKHWIEWNYLLVKWGQHFCKRNHDLCQICADILDLLKK